MRNSDLSQVSLAKARELLGLPLDEICKAFKPNNLRLEQFNGLEYDEIKWLYQSIPHDGSFDIGLDTIFQVLIQSAGTQEEFEYILSDPRSRAEKNIYIVSERFTEWWIKSIKYISSSEAGDPDFVAEDLEDLGKVFISLKFPEAWQDLRKDARVLMLSHPALRIESAKV